MRRCLGRFPHGIVVNGVLPGPTTTPMLIKEDTNKIALNEASVPIGRYVIPKEIANMAVDLTSGLGNTIVGDIIYDGRCFSCYIRRYKL